MSKGMFISIISEIKSVNKRKYLRENKQILNIFKNKNYFYERSFIKNIHFLIILLCVTPLPLVVVTASQIIIYLKLCV